MHSKLFFLPQGLSDNARGRWAKTIGRDEHFQMREADGGRLERVSHIGHLLSLMETFNRMGCSALLGLCYAHWLNATGWQRERDAGHPMLCNYPKEARTRVSLEKRVHGYIRDQMKMVDLLDGVGFFDDDLIPERTLFFSPEHSREGWLYEIDAAPTSFMLGLYTGHLIVHDWHKSVYPNGSAPRGVGVVV